MGIGSVGGWLERIEMEMEEGRGERERKRKREREKGRRLGQEWNQMFEIYIYEKNKDSTLFRHGEPQPFFVSCKR